MSAESSEHTGISVIPNKDKVGEEYNLSLPDEHNPANNEDHQSVDKLVLSPRGNEGSLPFSYEDYNSTTQKLNALSNDSDTVSSKAEKKHTLPYLAIRALRIMSGVFEKTFLLGGFGAVSGSLIAKGIYESLSSNQRESLRQVSNSYLKPAVEGIASSVKFVSDLLGQGVQTVDKNVAQFANPQKAEQINSNFTGLNDVLLHANVRLNEARIAQGADQWAHSIGTQLSEVGVHAVHGVRNFMELLTNLNVNPTFSIIGGVGLGAMGLTYYGLYDFGIQRHLREKVRHIKNEKKLNKLEYWRRHLEKKLQERRVHNQNTKKVERDYGKVKLEILDHKFNRGIIPPELAA